LESEKLYTKYGKIEAWGSLFLNSVLFVVKYWAGVVSGSVALIADAWHTLSDSVSSLVVLIGVKFSTKPADKEHPFGHGRAELIASIIIGVLLAMVGITFFHDSVNALRHHEKARFGVIAIVVTVLSMVSKEIMAQVAIRMGKKVNSTAMVADGWHHRADAISSAVILIGIFVGRYYWWMDGLLGIFVALFIFYTTYSIMKEAISPLLGEEIGEEERKEMIALLNSYAKMDLHIHHVHLHSYGRHNEITMHIKLPKDLTLDHVHYITDDLEKIVKKEMNMTATIHVDPL
jgi:cation diffusion facilitator family transporter